MGFSPERWIFLKLLCGVHMPYPLRMRPQALCALSMLCSAATETTSIPPLVHSELETGRLPAELCHFQNHPARLVALGPRSSRLAVGTEAENWSLEAPLAELSEFMKRKKKTWKNCSSAALLGSSVSLQPTRLKVG